MSVLGEEAKGFSALRKACVAVVGASSGCCHTIRPTAAAQASAAMTHVLAHTGRDIRRRGASSLPTSLSNRRYTSKNAGTDTTAAPHSHVSQLDDANIRPATHKADATKATNKRTVRPPLTRASRPSRQYPTCLKVFFTTAWYVTPTARNALASAQTTARHHPGATAVTRLNRKSAATTATALMR